MVSLNMPARPHEASGASATYDTMMSLHTARFAAPLLRILFFLRLIGLRYGRYRHFDGPFAYVKTTENYR